MCIFLVHLRSLYYKVTLSIIPATLPASGDGELNLLPGTWVVTE